MDFAFLQKFTWANRSIVNVTGQYISLVSAVPFEITLKNKLKIIKISKHDQAK